MSETNIPPVSLPPQAPLPLAPRKKGFFTNIYEAILALFLLVGAGAAMAGYFTARFLFRWLIWFPFNIFQTALYIILYYLRNFAALALALLMLAGGGAYFLDVNMKQDLGVEKVVGMMSDYFSGKKSEKKQFTTLASITQKDMLPRELDPMLNIELAPEIIDAYATVIGAGTLGARAEGAIPILSKQIYSQDEKTRTAADAALRLIGTREAIKAISDYYAYAKQATHGKKNPGR